MTILMSSRRNKKLNLLIEFSNWIFTKFYILVLNLNSKYIFFYFKLTTPRDPYLHFTTFENSVFVQKRTLIKLLGKMHETKILISKKELFQHSEVIQVGISDRHSFIVISLKNQVAKGNAKTKDTLLCKWKYSI